MTARWGIVSASSALLGLGSLNSGTSLGYALGTLIFVLAAVCLVLALRHRRVA